MNKLSFTIYKDLPTSLTMLINYSIEYLAKVQTLSLSRIRKKNKSLGTLPASFCIRKKPEIAFAPSLYHRKILNYKITNFLRSIRLISFQANKIIKCVRINTSHLEEKTEWKLTVYVEKNTTRFYIH